VGLLLSASVEQVRSWNRYLNAVSLVSGTYQRLNALLGDAEPHWLWERL